MNQEEFSELVKKVRAGWPTDRIIKEDQTTLVVQCDNEGFIRFSLMLLTDELLKTVPQMTIDMMHEKLLIQYTENLEKGYVNLGRMIQGMEEPVNDRVKDALWELSFRVQLGAVFT